MSTTHVLPRSPKGAARSVREHWARDVRELLSQTEQWAARQGLKTSAQEVTMTEDSVGTYTVPVLTFEAQNGSLILEPIACRTPGADGRVDLYAYPSLARVVLLRQAGAERTVWTVRTSDGVDWPESWTETTFLHLMAGLLRVS